MSTFVFRREIEEQIHCSCLLTSGRVVSDGAGSPGERNEMRLQGYNFMLPSTHSLSPPMCALAKHHTLKGHVRFEASLQSKMLCVSIRSL